VQEVHHLQVAHTWDALAQECIARSNDSAVELVVKF